MGRLIDGDVLMELLTTAIMNMKGMAKFLDLEDDPEIKMEIKAYTDIANGVKDMPTIEPEPKWIPCSERLPKIGKEVLLSEPNDMFIAEYYGSGLPEGVWRVDGIDHYLQDIKGCAWMPLPEPWKEGEK